MDQAREKRDSIFGGRNIPPASKGFAFASLLAQASIASRCQFRSAAEERLEERKSEEPSSVRRPRPWTRPWKERENTRLREREGEKEENLSSSLVFS